MTTKPFVCQYCKHGYTKESSLMTHICEQKRRHLAKAEKHVVIAHQAFIRFFQLTQNAKGVKTYEEFSKSPYYNAFVKFGSFVSNTSPLYPQKYIEFVVTSGAKLDQWCRDELYERYILNLIMTESADTALERTLGHMQAWADKNNTLWNCYFKHVSPNRVVFDIKDGKISPWVVLNCKSGKSMLTSLVDEQLNIIEKFIDPTAWLKKFKQHPADVILIREVAKEGNL